jgi:N-acetylmuramoyl-L-alanine amidase
MPRRRPIAEGLAAAVFGLCLSLCAPARAAVPTPDVHGVGLIGVRFGGDAATTRVVLDLDSAVTAKLVAADGGADRLVLSLPPLLTAGPLTGTGSGLVKGWSIVEEGHGAKLVLVLAQGAAPTRRFLIPPDAEGGRWRYVIDLADTDPLAVLAAGGALPASAAPPVVASRAPALRPIGAVPAVLSPPPTVLARAAPPPATPAAIPYATRVAPPTPARAPAALDAEAAPQPQRLLVSHPAAAGIGARRGMKIIVVDAGHGGHDTGARSLVRNEKDINLAAALDLRDRLEAMGRYKVVMTRSSDVFIPLEERVKIARRAGADLFISLHSDSAGSDPTPHGASVYTVSDHGETRVNNVLGPNEWFSRVADKDAGVRQLLLDLTQRSTRNRSAQFAHILIDHINDKVDLLPRSHRDAGYFVLLAPDVPAVLLEMGFITNPSDELRLTDPAQRGRLMDGVADAIDTYFSGETRMAAGF